MDNHVHIALERGPVALSRIMLTVQSSYAQEFNRRHRRIGHLFQGRYKAFLVEDERYLLELVRYIHLNPVAARLVTQPAGFRWSSDRYYRAGSGPGWLDIGRLLDRFSHNRPEAASVYRRLMADRSAQTYEDVPSFLRAIKGEAEFANRALATVGEARRITIRCTPEQIARLVAHAEHFTVERLRGPSRNAHESRVRLIAAFLGRREGGHSTAAMARCFGREESTFNRGVRRLEQTMARDPVLRARIEVLSRLLQPSSTGIHD
jgi:hypothetical protein